MSAPAIFQNDPKYNVQGDLKLQYTQHDFQQAPRCGTNGKWCPRLGTQTVTNLTNPTGVLAGFSWTGSM